MTDSPGRKMEGKGSDRPAIGDVQITVSGSVNGQLGVGHQVVQIDQTPPAGTENGAGGATAASPSLTAGESDLPSFRPAELVKLRRSLSLLFNESELRDLCFDLGLDYDDLPGAGKNDKARELVGYFHRRGRIGELVQACMDRRPGISKGEARGPPAR